MDIINPPIPTKEEKEGSFKHDVYLFNGHGGIIINPQTNKVETFTLPHHTYYVTVVKCGKKSEISSSNLLTNFSNRNSFFDTIPNNSEEFKNNLKDFFLLQNSNEIEVKGPDDQMINEFFMPLSSIIINVNKTKFLFFDGPPGLILRDNYIGTGKANLKNILNKRFTVSKVDETTKKELEHYGIDFDFNIKENLPIFYSTSTYPTPKQFQEFFIQNNRDIVKTINEFYKIQKPIQEIIRDIRRETDIIDPNRVIIFYNPLCRNIEKLTQRQAVIMLNKSGINTPGGKRRKTRRKKLKRQTRRRR